MTEAPKPTKVDKLKEAQKAWKAGVRAVAKFKFISPEEKSELLTRFDEQFKAAIEVVEGGSTSGPPLSFFLCLTRR